MHACITTLLLSNKFTVCFWISWQLFCRELKEQQVEWKKGLFSPLLIVKEGLLKLRAFTPSSNPKFEGTSTCHWRTMASFVMPFSSHVCMHTNHSTKCNNYTRLLNLKYGWCPWSFWREPGVVNDSSANTVYIYWGSLWGRTAAL